MPEKTVIADSRHEVRDVSGKFIAGAFFLLVGGLGTVGLLCWGIFPRATQDEYVPVPVVSKFPQPRLQPSPPQDWRRFYESEMTRLNSYGWLDKGAGVAHIPISQAMQDVAKSGIAGWPGTPQASAGGGG